MLRVAECAPRGVTYGISLRFDDAPAESSVASVMDHYFANQVTRQLHRINREFRTPKPPKPANRNCPECACHDYAAKSCPRVSRKLTGKTAYGFEIVFAHSRGSPRWDVA